MDAPLTDLYEANYGDMEECERLIRRLVHYVIRPEHLWTSIVEQARVQNGELLNTLQSCMKYIEDQSFESTFNGLFSEINLSSEKLGKTYTEDRKSTRLNSSH